jgi:hypothetical protein
VKPEEALQIVLDQFEARGILYMITGSFASNAHGVPRVTYDADVVIETDQHSLHEFMGNLGADFYADAEAAMEAFAGIGMFNIIHMPTGFKIDVILRKARPFSEEEFHRRQEIAFLGRPRPFAAPEDTILAKLEWPKMGESERQFNDALNVARVQYEDLDRAYLSKWAKELGIVDLLQRLLSELETRTH